MDGWMEGGGREERERRERRESEREAWFVILTVYSVQEEKEGREEGREERKRDRERTQENMIIKTIKTIKNK